MSPRLAALFALLLCVPAHGQQARLDAAFTAAIATFEEALPALAPVELGVDVAAYRDALTLQRFTSTHWGGTVTLATTIPEAATGSCARFAAYVRIPPEAGTVRLVLCPQFFTSGTDGLRELTILHELVHVVAGSDECQAMAFAARIQHAASGSFTPIDAYWQANGCEVSAFTLP